MVSDRVLGFDMLVEVLIGVVLIKSGDLCSWDCCGPNGLLERVYRNLGISQRAWPGLKQLPEIGGLSINGQQTYIQLVNGSRADQRVSICMTRWSSTQFACEKN